RDHLTVSGVRSSHGSSDGSSSSSSSLPASINAFAWYSHHSTTFLRTGSLTCTKDKALAIIIYQQIVLTSLIGIGLVPPSSSRSCRISLENFAAPRAFLVNDQSFRFFQASTAEYLQIST